EHHGHAHDRPPRYYPRTSSLIDSRNDDTVCHQASGFSNCGLWPASGITFRVDLGRTPAMRSVDPRQGASCSPTSTTVAGCGSIPERLASVSEQDVSSRAMLA